MKIEVNTDILQRDIQRLESLQGKLKDRLNSMNTAITSLNSSWEGEAKSAYTATYKQDYKDIQELEIVLTKFIQRLKDAKRDYEKSSKSIQSLVNQLKV